MNENTSPDSQLTAPPAEPTTLRGKIGNFFYAEEVPYGMALVRILLPLALLVPMLPRWIHARELYSLDGAPTPLWESYGWPGLLPLFSGEIMVALHTGLILALVLCAIGWCTRISLVTAFLLFTYINLCDAISTITKYSVIASHGLLILSFSSCGAVWSIDRWLQKRRLLARNATPEELRPQASPRWARRLLQLTIAFVYFGAAFTKMHTPAYFSGDQLVFWMLTNVNSKHPLGELMAQYPAVVVFGAYLTFIWEVTFIFLSWKGLSRIIFLGMGVVFHIMTALTLGLYVFPLVCTAIYFGFMNENDVENFRLYRARLQNWFSRKSRQAGESVLATVAAVGSSGMPAVAAATGNSSASHTTTEESAAAGNWHSPLLAWCAVMLVTMSTGVIAERAIDPFGERRPEGRHTLQPIDPAVARELLARSEAIRDVDKVFTFDTGTTLVSGFLAATRREFDHGENVFAQVNMNPPHEDMYVECELRDSRQRVLERIGIGVPREEPRIHYLFPMQPSYQPGEYTLHLSSGGSEIATHRFTLTDTNYNRATTPASQPFNPAALRANAN